MAVFVDGADDDGTLEVVFEVGEAGGEFGYETGSIYSKQHPHHQFRISFFLHGKLPERLKRNLPFPAARMTGTPRRTIIITSAAIFRSSLRFV